MLMHSSPEWHAHWSQPAGALDRAPRCGPASSAAQLGRLAGRPALASLLCRLIEAPYLTAPAMTTFLRQQKRSAFIAGLGTAAGLYVYTKLAIRRLTEETAQQLPGGAARKVEAPAAAPEPVLRATAWAWAVRRWNEGVDAVFKPAVEALARRNL
ncbi:hypothetical protein ABPG75_006003 [Micractinium tetrahymenae]